MKEKISFWTYFKAMNFGVPAKTGGVSYFEMFIPTGLLFFFLNFLGGFMLPYSCVIAIVFPAAIYINFMITKVTPSLFRLLPMGRKRRTVYFFLSVLFTVFVYLVALLLFILVLSLLLAFILLIFTGNFSFTASAAVRIGLQGQILSAALIFLIAGAELIAVAIPKKKLRLTILILFPILIGIVLRLLMASFGIRMGELFYSFDTIPNSYIYLIIFGGLGIALTALGAFLTAKFLRPKDF